MNVSVADVNVDLSNVEVLEIENMELESADSPVCFVRSKNTSGAHHCS